jgi:hypothetical protein
LSEYKDITVLLWVLGEFDPKEISKDLLCSSLKEWIQKIEEYVATHPKCALSACDDCFDSYGNIISEPRLGVLCHEPAKPGDGDIRFIRIRLKDLPRPLPLYLNSSSSRAELVRRLALGVVVSSTIQEK